jgi:hypothetical protein
MCPVCLTTAVLIAAGASTTGGLATLVARKIRGKTRLKVEADRTRQQTNQKEEKYE